MSTSISLPDALYEQVARLAGREGLSVPDFVARVLANEIAAHAAYEERAARGDRARFERVLDKVADRDPEPHDRL